MSQEPPDLETSAESAASMPDPSSPRQILIIEDDEDLSSLLAIWLRDHYGDQADVNVATTIDDAIDQLSSLARVDVVLLDRRFPDGSGDDLLELLHSRFDPIVVMITGMAPAEGIIRLPITDYLVKPIDREPLIKRLALLEKLRAATVLEAYADARKASLLEFHLEDPEAHPLYRRFAAKWSYDRIEVADDGDTASVYELYVAEQRNPTAGISVQVVGTLGASLEELVSAGELTPVGELVPEPGGHAWIDVSRNDVIDPAPDGYVIYEFTGASPETHVSPGAPEEGRRLERVLEEAYR